MPYRRKSFDDKLLEKGLVEEPPVEDRTAVEQVGVSALKSDEEEHLGR